MGTAGTADVARRGHAHPHLVLPFGAVTQTEISIRRGPAEVLRPAARELAMTDLAGRQRRWQELTKSECFGLLAGQRLGRVAVVDDLGPIALPVNYVVDRHTVVFRTDEGTKLDAARQRTRVAFEVDGADAATRSGWSVVVRGEATEITDPAELAALRRLPLFPWAPGAKSRYVRILPAMLTGRRFGEAGGAAIEPMEPARAGPSAGRRDEAG
jgi:uncharacterized protein